MEWWQITLIVIAVIVVLFVLAGQVLREVLKHALLAQAIDRADRLSRDPEMARQLREEAINLARDRHTRRSELRSRLESMPITIERHQVVWSAYHNESRDLAIARRAGLRGKPLRDAERLLKAIKWQAEETQKRDKHCHEAGLDVIRKRINQEIPFCLLLRAYALEARGSDADLPELVPFFRSIVAARGDEIEPGMPVTLTVRPPGQRAIDIVAKILRPEVRTLTIANALDMFTNDADARLLLPSWAWRHMVFPLIAEASAIIFILPFSANGAGVGVAEELEGIGRLRVGDRTFVVLDPDPEPAAPRDELQRISANLAPLGLRSIHHVSELRAAPAEFLSDIKALVAKA